MKKLMIELSDETKEKLEILSAFTRTAQGKICQRAVEKELDANAEKIRKYRELVNAEKI